MTISYYRRAQAGEPVIGDLMAVRFRSIAETIAENAALATEKFFAKHEFPSQIKLDTFTTTLKRKHCQINDIHIYETFFDNPLSGSVTYLSTACIKNESIALAVGIRGRNSAIDRMSGYPYLAVSIDRLKEEFALANRTFQWEDF